MGKIVTDTKIRARGRPRGFDPEAGVIAGERLFHAHGYDGIGIAALTEALGIRPPSFYSAYGSKIAFFERVLNGYAAKQLPLADLLRDGRAPADALADLLAQAAEAYAADPERRGCLVLEAVHGTDAESVRLASAVAEGRRARIRAFVASTHPAVAGEVTDFVASSMAGLSACAREGMGAARLATVATVAARAIRAILEDDDASRPPGGASRSGAVGPNRLS
jgi:TetR/AcrR family transcriptional regulator, repressor for divergent bdcA